MQFSKNYLEGKILLTFSSCQKQVKNLSISCIVHYPLKKWVEKIQTAGCNGASTVRTTAHLKECVQIFHKVLWRVPPLLNGLLLIPCRKKLMFEFSIEKVCAKLTARFAHTSSLFFFSPSPTFSPLFSNFSGIFLNPIFSPQFECNILIQLNTS